MKTDSDHDEATSLSAPSRSDKDDSSASIEKHHYKLALAEPTACPARKVKGKEQDHDKEIDTEQVVALKEHGDEHTTLAILESNDPTDCQTKTNQNKITVKQNTQSEQHTSRPGAFRIRGIADGGDEYDEEATVTIGYSAAAPRPIDATHSQTNIIASENKTAAGVNLIQAEMVPELVTAVAKREEDSDEDKIPRRKKCLCVLICIAFIIVIVGTVVGPVFGGGEPQRAGPVPAPSLMPSSTTSPTKHVGNLFTTLNYTHAFFGHMFDVTAKKDVVITGMDIHLDSTDDETIGTFDYKTYSVKAKCKYLIVFLNVEVFSCPNLFTTMQSYGQNLVRSHNVSR